MTCSLSPPDDTDQLMPLPTTGLNIFNGVSCGASQACTAVRQTQDPGQIESPLIEAGD